MSISILALPQPLKLVPHSSLGRTPHWVPLRRSVLALRDGVRGGPTDRVNRVLSGGRKWGCAAQPNVGATLQRQKKRKTIEDNPGEVPDPSEFRCLVCARDGKKKISCSLTAKDHLRFQTSYATVLKAHMDSLKEKENRDKKDKKTTAAKASAS